MRGLRVGDHIGRDRGARAFGLVATWVRGLTLLAVFSCVLAAPALAGDREETRPARKNGAAYLVDIRGPLDPDTLALLREVSQCVALTHETPDSLFLLERRMADDAAAFGKVMNSLGRFAARIDSRLEAEAAPPKVVFEIDPGPVFVLKDIAIRLPEGESARRIAVPEPAELGLSLGAPARAKDIVAAQDKLTASYRDSGFPFATIENRSVTADFQGHGVSVVWNVDPGPRGAFGQTRFEGLETVKESLTRREIPWKEGAPFDARLLADYEKALTALDLFTMIRVEPDSEVADSGRVGIVVSVVERKHRTFKGGVDYRTDEGPGARLSWEHRNLFGQGERLKLAAGASPIEQSADFLFENPAFLSPAQKLRLKANVKAEEKVAYEGQSATAEVTLHRQFTRLFSAGAGLGARASRIDQDQARPWEGQKNYGFVYLPFEATLDTRDDLLDPSRGVMATAGFAPFFGTLSGAPNFLRPMFDFASYIKLMDSPGAVLAGRVSVGADFGAETDDIPPDLRFYAGGGGSIRGYPYQTVGPLRGTKPLGGGSVMTFSSELRLRVSEYIGIVPFLDGGTAYESALPPYNQPVLLGAGLGVRVYTPIGPIRVDAATPLTPRQDIDALAQFYVSIGQSF